MPTQDGLDKKFAELEHRLSVGYDQIGRGVGVPFLLLLYPPNDELRIRRETATLVTKLRAAGRMVEVIDCNDVLLGYLDQARELDRTVKAERRKPTALREFGLGDALADAIVARVTTVEQQLSGSGVVFLTRLAALHPFLVPNLIQERLAGKRVGVPIVFFVPAVDDDGGGYLFLGVEKASRYRGTYI